MKKLLTPAIIRPPSWHARKRLSNHDLLRFKEMNRRDLMKAGAAAATAAIMPRIAEAGATLIPLGTNLSSVQGTSTNTTFILSGGIYRQPMVVPNTGNQFVGWPDGSSVISGAWLLNGSWVNTSGTLWKTTTGSYDNSGGQVALSTGNATNGMTYDTTGFNNGGQKGGYPLCLWCNELFIDNIIRPFIGQGTTASPLSPDGGQWWWNTTDNSLNFNAAGFGAFPGTHMIEYSNQPASGNKWDNAHITITGFTIEKYPNPSQDAPAKSQRPGFLADAMVFQWNHGPGLYCTTLSSTDTGGSPSIIRNCRMIHNGQEGFSSNQSIGLQIINSEFGFNNRAGYNIDWDAGGLKLFACFSGTFTGNWVHDNYGHGAWWDGYCANWEIYNNFINNNAALPNSPDPAASGLFYEACYGGASRLSTKIYNNVIANHIGAGIYLSASDGMEVFGNVVTCGASNAGTARNGCIAVAVNDHHPASAIHLNGWTFTPKPLVTINQNVHDNCFIHLTDRAADGIYAANAVMNPNWTWNNNIYIVPNATGAFWIFQAANGTGGRALTWSQVQAAGYESTGQQVVSSPYATAAAVMNALRDGQAGVSPPSVVRNSLMTWFTMLKLPIPNN